MHDVYIAGSPPARDTIPDYRPGARIETRYVQVDPARISMYTEVIQDSIFQLVDADRLEIASTCSLTLSSAGNEHSVQVIVTDRGVADLRGKSPVEKALAFINDCAHPDYRPQLQDYLDYGLKDAPFKHTPHTLERAFGFHTRFMVTGSMKEK